ncbi:MAG: hypothetical protein V7K25_16655 [Nostoc sp.]|uniref:hypothetical protein n=1 Tax=unclassified Nostoc TaxID=2593658 RepID=UPI001E4E8E31|nr:hypothetical protein [Nostoc sp. XA010]MCC5660615.1 hypothetical protein [Nostoc sp. XA010]
MPNYIGLFSPSIRPLAMVLSLGIALGSGLGYGFCKAVFDSKQHEQSATNKLNPFSRVEYEQLKPEMSLTEVRSILSQGIEVSRSATMVTFVWANPDGSKITATFDENYRLKSKEQSGLK